MEANKIIITGAATRIGAAIAKKLSGPWELEQTKGKFVEQIIRPTGLIDPPVEIKPAKNQVDDLMHECKKTIDKNFRVLVTTLTKKMAEGLTEYFHENGIRVRYLHSDIDTLERIEITLNPKVKKYNSKNKIYPKGRSTMGKPGTRAKR